MPRVLVVLLVVLLAALRPPHPAQAAELIFEAFDPAPLNPSEKRLLQTALAATGDYQGTLDGVWGQMSQQALDTYATREFGDAALNAHAAALVLGFLDEVSQRGWDFSYLPELGVSLALPLAQLTAPAPDDGGQRRWTSDGSLTILTQRLGRQQALTWHDAAARANARPEALSTTRDADLLVTGGVLRDGRIFYTRSDRTGADWATVYLAGAATEAGALNLVAHSIRPGRPLPWDLPQGGRLSGLVSATEDFLQEAGGKLADGQTPEPAPAPAAVEGEIGTSSTGTGFYLGARTVVTADHVIAGCNRVTLADGTGLTLIAADPDLDVAALMTPDRARHWLSLATGRLRLGQRVHAAGFPYYSIAGTSLNLTSGNVSALAGVDDDDRFFSFTAPVQPGNSGGPLIDAHGTVLGLVVARLSDDYIVEATGSLPQNVNYALNEAELAAFLRRSGVAASAGGLDSFDMDDGAPDGFDAAVVPILCDSPAPNPAAASAGATVTSRHAAEKMILRP